MASEQSYPVELYIYDLTNGLASVLSPAILGRPVDGVWHTAVVVHGREFFYGAHGVSSCAPGGTQLGPPHRVEHLGETFVPFAVFADYIQGLATSSFVGSAYRLLEHNCNHFSDEVAQFLCGARVPKHILQQPEHALPPPLRQALQALLDSVLPDAQIPVYAQGGRRSSRDSPDYRTLNDQIEEARVASQALERRRSTLAEKQARKERRREQKRSRRAARGDGPPEDDMAEAVEQSSPVELPRAGPGPSSAPGDSRDEEERRRRERDPPIVYRDIDGAREFEKLAEALGGVTLGDEEKQSLDELQQYLVQGEGSWVLGDEFLSFIGRLLRESALGGAVRVATLRCLAACALRDDVSLLLHQDRRHHALLHYAHNIDRHPLDEQLALALFMCNLFENVSSSEWLLYISEWDADGQALSNIRATTKVCVHAALSEQLELRELGTALMYNVATKEVFDEVCAELAMALLQLLQWAPQEEHLWRSVAALARLAQHSNDVPQLVALVGPHPDAFRGTSARVDEQIDLIAKTIK